MAYVLDDLLERASALLVQRSEGNSSERNEAAENLRDYAGGLREIIENSDSPIADELERIANLSEGLADKLDDADA